MAGPELRLDFPPLVLVTNAHVVPEGIAAEDVVIWFHDLDEEPGKPETGFGMRAVLWSQTSSVPGLYITVLELDGYPADVVPVPLAAKLPSKPLAHRHAYVIGHPRGLEQPQFSLQDNVLLDYNDRVLHYRSPTAGGRSGSPVFNDEWKLIGVHHAGGLAMPQLNGHGGTFAANEGIVISAIRAALSVSCAR